MQQGGHGGAADGHFGAVGLFGQGGDAVKAQEGEAGDGAGQADELQVHLAGAVQGIHDQLAGAAAFTEDIVEAEADEQGQDHSFHIEHDPVGTRGIGDAADVDEGIDAHEDDDPQPAGRCREKFHTPVGGHQIEQGGHEHIVQQDEPAGDEAHMVVQAALHIGVDRTRDGEAVTHLHVAQRREEHGADAHEVDEGRHHVAVFGNVAIDGHGGDDDHEQHTVNEDVLEAEFALQLLAVAKIVRGSCIRHKATSKRFLPGRRTGMSVLAPFFIKSKPNCLLQNICRYAREFDGRSSGRNLGEENFWEKSLHTTGLRCNVPSCNGMWLSLARAQRSGR